MISQSESQQSTSNSVGTLDGEGAGDHDLPYRFGRRPTVAQPCPFSTREFARLLVLRSRVQSGFDR